MAALKIVTVLALIALATTQPTDGAGGIEGQAEGGAKAAIKAGKGVAGQGKHWVDKGEEACEDGLKGVGGQIKHGIGQFGGAGQGGIDGVGQAALGVGTGFLGIVKGVFGSFL